jgi:CRISPR type II-A-associated protein Csn2
MKLKSLLFPEEVDLSSSDFRVIRIENPSLFYQVARYLYLDFAGSTEFFSLKADSGEVSIDQFSNFLGSLFNVDLNTKKNINCLYRVLKKTYFEKLSDDLDKLREQAAEIVKNISFDFDVELSVQNEIAIDDLFKIMNLQFSDNCSSLLERITKFILLSYELQHTSLFFALNLFEYLEPSEIKTLIHDVSYKTISIIDIESGNNLPEVDFGHMNIVDHDLCDL